jgi:hypothetical protein
MDGIGDAMSWRFWERHSGFLASEHIMVPAKAV